MLAELHAHKIPHAPMTVLFTVREESGLWGARSVDPADLGNPVLGFNIDGGSAEATNVGDQGTTGAQPVSPLACRVARLRAAVIARESMPSDRA